jgi:hypothetical protein
MKVLTTRGKKKSGQVMLEYVMALAVCLVLFAMATFLLEAFTRYGNRAVDLVGSEYP